MAMAIYTLGVYIDLNNDNFFSGTGETVSLYCQSLDLTLGKSDPLQLVDDIGVCKITLDNTDKRFSPGYTGSPYYPNFTEKRLVKCTVTNNITGITRTIFLGRISNINPDAGVYGAKHCMIECETLLVDLRDGENVAIPVQFNKTSDYLIKQVVNEGLISPSASGTINLSTQPANNATQVIDNQTYTYKTSLSGAANEILIGVSVYATLANLIAASNGDIGAGTTYGNNSLPLSNSTADLAYGFYQTAQGLKPQRYYRLDESSGTPCNDLSGYYGYGGSYGGTPTYSVTGALSSNDADTAITFNGTNTKITLPSNGFNFLTGNSYTLAFWIKVASYPGADRVIIKFDDNTGTGGHKLTVLLTSAGAIKLDNGSTTQTASTPIGTGAWVFVVISNLSGIVTIYQNNVVTLNVAWALLLGTPTVNLVATDNTNYLACSLDELLVYSYALTSTQAGNLYNAVNVVFGAIITATLRGTVGNSIALGAGFLSGGVDYPVFEGGSYFNYDIGKATFDVAADQWRKAVGSSPGTSALTALQDITNSEIGRFYVGLNGHFTYKSRSFQFTHIADPVALTLYGVPNIEFAQYKAIEDSKFLYTRVNVTVTPRAYLASGIVAIQNTPIVAAGQSGTSRWNGTAIYPGGGSTVIHLYYTDPATGQKIGAKNLILPLVPNTDWTANDAKDGSGFNYTGNTNLSFTFAVSASGVDISVVNKALGPIYITYLQVRGIGITTYSPITVTQDNANSQSTYGVRTPLDVTLSLATDPGLAGLYASYLLYQYGTPYFGLKTITFQGVNYVNGVDLYSLDITSIIQVTEPQLGITNQKYEVIGLHWKFTQGGGNNLEFTVNRMDAKTYGIFDNTTYGIFDNPACNFSI